MNLNEWDMKTGKPIPGLEPAQDIIIKLEDFDGEEYDNLTASIVKNSEGSRSLGSFIAFDFETVTRFESHGSYGIKCYEGIAVDTKGRTWFLMLYPEYRAYDVGWEAEDLVKKFLDQYVKEPA